MSFNLPDDDKVFLNTQFNEKWETVTLNGEQGVIITDYELPVGYNESKIELMLLVPQDYPMSALDMFYVSPDIAKQNGNSIEALTNEPHFSKEWQRWSRHYQWEPGAHSVATHLKFIENCFNEELQR